MLTLALRTDKPEAELYVFDGLELIAEIKWQAHRELADTLHTQIENILKKANKNLRDLEKLAIYQGPGSFTGLRIGFSLVNALGYSLDIPVVSCQGESWIDEYLKSSVSEYAPVYPEYGSEPHVTKPKK